MGEEKSQIKTNFVTQLKEDGDTLHVGDISFHVNKINGKWATVKVKASNDLPIKKTKKREELKADKE